MATKNAKDNNQRLEQVYSENRSRLFKCCYRYVNYDSSYLNEIEDIIHDACVAAIRVGDVFTSHECPYAWLSRACIDRIKSLIRKRNRRKEVVIFSIDEKSEGDVDRRTLHINEMVERIENEEIIREIFDLLTPSESEAFWDSFDGGMTAKESAEDKDTTEGAIKAALRRARKKGREIKEQWNEIIFFPLQWYLLVV